MRHAKPQWPLIYCFSLICFPAATLFVAGAHCKALIESAPERKRKRKLKKTVRKTRRRRQRQPPQETKPTVWPEYNFGSKLEESARSRGAVSRQEQSRFLTKLPLEIRQKIYQIVLGGHTSHLAHSYKRIFHARCTQDRDLWNDQQHECWQDQPQPWGSRAGGHLEMANAKFVACSEKTTALLQTCRIMTADVYAANTFIIRHPSTLVDLKSSIPISLFNAIHSLRLSLPFDIYQYDPDPVVPDPLFDARFWKQWWCMVAGMKGLRMLRVELCGCPPVKWNGETAERAISALEVLNEVWQTEIFELKIQHPQQLVHYAELGWIANAAFKLVMDDD